jgi:hypothetical protein
MVLPPHNKPIKTDCAVMSVAYATAPPVPRAFVRLGQTLGPCSRLIGVLPGKRENKMNSKINEIAKHLFPQDCEDVLQKLEKIRIEIETEPNAA